MQVGDQIGHYTIVEHIGRGGMADVWSARDERLRRTVAIKTIAANLTDPRARVSFEQEAQTIAALEHPNILPVYDFGEFERQLYIVMRYIAGGSLLDRLIEGPLPDSEVIRMGEALANALARAHAEQVVHRDLKPANVLIDQFEIPYLADFGLASMAGASSDEGISAGTLLYMPPEQLYGLPVDHRADIYAFAIMLFQMITGEFPFEGKAPLCLRQAQEGAELPDPRQYRPTLPEHIHTILRIATAIEVEARYDSAPLLMAEIASALQGTPTGMPDTTRPIIGPVEEPPPYHAETAAPEDLIMTLPGIADEDLLLTIKTDSEQLARAQAGQMKRAATAEPPALPPSPPPGGGEGGEEGEEEPEGERMALREARGLFQRMTRAWAHGQGRFLTGATHFAAIHAYYSQAEQHHLEIGDDGREAMLRGAVEHNYELAFWQSQLPDPAAQRKVYLHALRSALASARALAVRLLGELPEEERAGVAITAGRLLHSETSPDVRRAVVDLLSRQAEKPEAWRPYAYAVDTDLLLAEQALRTDAPDVAERAARAIGRLRSAAAVKHIAAQEADSPAQVRAALAWVRDEADSLPPDVPQSQRARAFRRLTAHYLSTDIGQLGLRFISSVLGTALGMAVYHVVAFRTTVSLLQLYYVYRVIGVAQTFGLVAGIAVALAAALPLRLAGSSAQRKDGATLWRGWARLLIGLGVGGFLGTVAYTNFQVVALQYQFSDLRVETLLLGGIGLALGCAAASTFRWPLAVRLLAAAATVFGSLLLGWELYKAGTTDAIIFLSGDDQLWTFLALAILTALGAYAPEINDWSRRLFRRQDR